MTISMRTGPQLSSPSWKNPLPAGRYHLVVFGAGTAGLVTAAVAADLGPGSPWSRIAHGRRLPQRRLRAVQGPDSRLAGRRLRVGRVRREAAPGSASDFPAVMARMRRLRAGLSPNDSARRFKSLGVDVFLGEARFTGPETVEVGGKPSGSPGGHRHRAGRRAADPGARPRPAT